MNVVLWARVSSREQREGYSIDAQLRAMRERAAKGGWTIVREFAVAESAKRGADRVAFNEMVRWVRKNAGPKKIDAILSHKLDRICRNMRDAVRMQELEDTCGVRLAFVENQFGPDAAGALSFNVMAAVAQYYSDNLRAEVLKGMDEKVRQGWPTGLAPYGYTNVDDKNEPVQPHPEKSQAVLRIFTLFASGQYTFKSLADKLQEEGFVYRPSQPRFHRTALSYLLNNRFYIGELHRNGKIHQGKYQLLIDRHTFQACQDILNGRNRRTGKPQIPLAGGLFRCAYCGFAISGERIRRKLLDGSIREHVYYRCANNHPDEDHPKVRWKAADLEEAVLAEFDALRFDDPELALWVRDSLEESLSDAAKASREQRRVFKKRRTELTAMQDRLLTGYLSGAIDEQTFTDKSADLKRQLEMVEDLLNQATGFDLPGIEEMRENALQTFDLSQNLREVWSRSDWAQKRDLLECVSLNRMLSDTSLVLAKRKPFDLLAERPLLKKSRGDWI